MKREPAKSHKNIIILNTLFSIFCKSCVLVIYQFKLQKGLWFVILTGTLHSEMVNKIIVIYYFSTVLVSGSLINVFKISQS